jgi:hypothetical protein
MDGPAVSRRGKTPADPGHQPQSGRQAMNLNSHSLMKGIFRHITGMEHSGINRITRVLR